MTKLDSIKLFVLNNIYPLITIFLLMIIIGFNAFVYAKTNEQNKSLDNVKEVTNQSFEEEILEEKIIKVDIKGQVEKPGVYEMLAGSIVYDVIQMAGGLKKSASTENINLSKKVSDESVITIYSTKELKATKSSEIQPIPIVENCPVVDITKCPSNETSNNVETNNSESNSNNETNNKVNLNTAVISELMTLSGIGESKANAIIEYRNKSGLFKTIEDLKNVSGIGESTFDKIKDNITV